MTHPQNSPCVFFREKDKEGSLFHSQVNYSKLKREIFTQNEMFEWGFITQHNANTAHCCPNFQNLFSSEMQQESGEYLSRLHTELYMQ